MHNDILDKTVTVADNAYLKDQVEESLATVEKMQEKLAEEMNFRHELDQLFDIPAKIKDLKATIEENRASDEERQLLVESNGDKINECIELMKN